MRNLNFHIMLLLITTFFVGCKSTEENKGYLNPLEKKVKSALNRAGENAEEIKNFILKYPPGTEKGKAARFLVAFMPTVDLASLTTKDLVENLELAFKVRRKDVPFPLFLHYVLPHRVTQEKYTPWRKFFYSLLSPYLKKFKSLEEAIISINNWCAKWVKFKQTEFRDQNSIDTYKSGYGRCEEMMIVSIQALRAAGIPARPCAAPWWVVTDNNHAWVEVWADGKWYFIGGCERLKALNETWFASPAKRAGFVVSTMYGTQDLFPTNDRVYKKSLGTAYINSTHVYTATGILSLEITNKQECPFSVCCFNFGALRPLTVRKTDALGHAEVELGIGSFFLCAGQNGLRAYKIIKIKPGSKTHVKLTLSKNNIPPKSFWLKYPTPKQAKLVFPRPAVGKVHEIKYIDIPKPPPPDLYEPGKDKDLDNLLKGFDKRKKLEQLLKDSLGNWQAIAKAIKTLGKDKIKWSLAFLEVISHLDRLEVTTKAMVDHVKFALEAKRKEYPEKLFKYYVLNPIIYLEHISAWRKRLKCRFPELRTLPPDTGANLIKSWISKNLFKGKRGRLGPYMDPEEVLISRHPIPIETVIFCTGVFRAGGIPARKKQHELLVEYHDGSKWKVFDPFSSKKKKQKDNLIVPGKLKVKLIRNGKILKSYKNIAVSRFENGAWIPLRPRTFSKEGIYFTKMLLPGEYLLTGGIRNRNGDVWVKTSQFIIKPKKELVLTLDLTPPKAPKETWLPVKRNLKKLPNIKIKNIPLKTILAIIIFSL